MKKHLATALLFSAIAIIPGGLIVHASDVEQKQITFRSIPWNSTKSEVESILFEDGGKAGG